MTAVVCVVSDYGNGTGHNISYYNDQTDMDYYNDMFKDPVETAVANNIDLYVNPFLLFFGTFGNILALIVMLKICMEVSSTCIYLAVLTVPDLLLLYTRCGNDWLYQIIQIDLSTVMMVYSESICKVYPFLYNFMFHMSRWLLVALSIEGFIQIKYPDKAIYMCTLSRAKAVILLLTVLLVCVNVHYFWSFEIVDVMQFNWNQGIMCTFSKYSNQYSEEFQNIIWPLIDLLVAEVLPNVVIIACTTSMMVLIIRGQHRGSESHQKWRSRYILDPYALDNLKLTYFVVALCHFPLTLPNFILYIYRFMMSKKGDDYMYDGGFQAKMTLARSVVAMLQYIFLSCKFFLYIACCSKFRMEFLRLTRCGCRHKVHNPSTQISRPLMKKDSMSSIHTNSTHKWRNMEDAELESPIIARASAIP